MSATREADELVRLWQELQAAQVAGDVRRLAMLQMLATARAQRSEAPHEWELLAREAGRFGSQLQDQAEAQPTAGVGGSETMTGGFEPVEEWEVDEVAVPDSAWEPAEDEEAAPRRGRGLGPIVWLVLIVGYLLLQMFGGGGDSP